MTPPKEMNKTIDKVTTKRMALYTGRTHPALAAEQIADAGVFKHR